MIKVSNLKYSYKNKPVLEDINLSFLGGEVHVIYGKNGEGKTTLVKCICGLIKPDKGKIDFCGVEKSSLGLRLNNLILIPKLKVQEYLEFICELKKIEKSVYTERIENYLTALDFIDERQTMIENLSMGTKSKLSLVATLVFNPDLLILDEPFSGMDLTAMDMAIKLIKKRANSGCHVIISTHQTDLLLQFIDRLSILKDGVIKESWSNKLLSRKIESQEISSVAGFLKTRI